MKELKETAQAANPALGPGQEINKADGEPSQPVEMDSAAYQLNAAGTEYGWIAFV